MIDELKNKLWEERPALSPTDVDPCELTVWKTKGEMDIDNSTRLAEILNSIDVNDVDAIEEIGER